MYTRLVKVVNHRKTFETIAHELWQVVVEMLVNEFQVLLYIGSELFYIVENLPEALFHVRQHF